MAFCIFDVLIYEGRDVMKTALRHRKALLGALLSSRPEALLRMTHLENDGEWLCLQAAALELEGNRREGFVLDLPTRGAVSAIAHDQAARRRSIGALPTR